MQGWLQQTPLQAYTAKLASPIVQKKTNSISCCVISEQQHASYPYWYQYLCIEYSISYTLLFLFDSVLKKHPPPEPVKRASPDQ